MELPSGGTKKDEKVAWERKSNHTVELLQSTGIFVELDRLGFQIYLVNKT